MKNLAFLLMLMASIAFVAASCNKDDNKTTVINEDLPNGKFTVQHSGDLVAQSGTPTTGTVELGTDDNGDQFIHFASNFSTDLGTGTVTIYLSKDQMLQFDPANGNPDLEAIGFVSATGESYFKVKTPVGNDFTYLVLWCGSANIPFGYAPLQ